MILEAPEDYVLSTYEPVRVKERPVHVTDEMIESQLAREMARFARFEDAPGPAQEGECLRVGMRVLLNGEPEEELCQQNATVVLSHDLQPKGFVNGVEGMNVGETREFDFDAFDKQAPSGQANHFHVRIELLEKQRRVTPELTDEFVRTRLSERDKTVEEFRARVRSFLENEQRTRNAQRREQAAVEKLGERLVGTIPDELIEQQRDQIQESLAADLAASGMTLTQFMEQQGMDERRFQMTILMQARESLRQGFALDALYRHLQIPIDEQRRAQALKELASGSEQEARRLCDENDAWDLVEVMAKRQAACDWLMKTAIFE